VYTFDRSAILDSVHLCKKWSFANGLLTVSGCEKRAFSRCAKRGAGDSNADCWTCPRRRLIAESDRYVEWYILFAKLRDVRQNCRRVPDLWFHSNSCDSGTWDEVLVCISVYVSSHGANLSLKDREYRE
jgi:hypothetical protein